MSPPSIYSRAITVAVLVACSALGAYTTFGAGFKNGLFASLRKAAGPDVDAESKYYPGGPEPYKTTFTGLPAIDDRLCTFISVFTVLLDGPRTRDVPFVSNYLFTQFLAGWILLSLEGLRQGNRGRIVSWTGTLGFIFQNVTYTVSVPIWLVIHVLTSPISQLNPSASTLAVDMQDLYILPKVVVGAFVVPTIMMSLPSPEKVSPNAHYNWQALWQVFPVAQSVYHWVYRRVTSPINFKPNSSQQIDDIYRIVMVLSFVPHTALLALAATPAQLVPGVVESLIPGITEGIIKQVDIKKLFIPDLPWNSPTVSLEGATDTVSVAGLVELVKAFLQWDIYFGGAAILAWSVFVYSVARPEKSLLGILTKALVATLFGGPVGAATVLLWERDAAAREHSKNAKPAKSLEAKN